MGQRHATTGRARRPRRSEEWSAPRRGTWIAVERRNSSTAALHHALVMAHGLRPLPVVLVHGRPLPGVIGFVDGDELALVGRDLVEREDRVGRADRGAGAAVDALRRIDVDLGDTVERCLVVPRMDAVDRAGLNAELVFDAVVGDYVGHDVSDR